MPLASTARSPSIVCAQAPPTLLEISRQPTPVVMGDCLSAAFPAARSRPSSRRSSAAGLEGDAAAAAAASAAVGAAPPLPPPGALLPSRVGSNAASSVAASSADGTAADEEIEAALAAQDAAAEAASPHGAALRPPGVLRGSSTSVKEERAVEAHTVRRPSHPGWQQSPPPVAWRLLAT